MNQTLQNNTTKINDYLDLLNYAKQIGDTAWQDDILNILKQLNNTPDNVTTSSSKEPLWERFDEINANMIDLYVSIRKTEDNSIKQQLLEQMWELKLERISISQQIKHGEHDAFNEDFWFKE